MHLRPKAAPAPDVIDWSSHARLTDLSLELLDRILHDVNRRDLLLLLTIAPLHAAAERQLWRRLMIDLSQPAQNESLLSALKKRADRQEYIRRLSIRRSPFALIRKGRSDLERAIDLLRLAPALTDLELRSRLRHTLRDPLPDHLAADFAEALSTSAANLKRLHLFPPLAEVLEDVEGGRIPTRLEMTRPFVQALSAFTRLTVIDLWEVSFQQSPIVGPPPDFKLSKLSMNRVTIPADHFSWMLSITARSNRLRDLELSQVTCGSTESPARNAFCDVLLRFLSDVAPGLQRLSLALLPAVLDSEERKPADVFRRLSGLQRLLLDIRDLPTSVFDALPVEALGERLVDLQLLLVTTLLPAKVVSTVARLPKLRSVRIKTHASGPHVIGTEESWIWPRAERRSLRAACQLHGIVLEIDNLLEPDEVELSSADEADGAGEASEEEPLGYGDDDELFVLDDARRAMYEEERSHDFALLEEARRKGDDPSSSQDEFMDAVTTDEELL